MMTDEQWQAIVNNDPAHDGRWFYAVKTTRIFCRPSCKSRPPLRINAVCFAAADEAIAAGFRPCKRCKPTGERLPDEEWIALVADYINRHFASELSLHHLAEACHGTPFHLHRTFKKVRGITPATYIQQTRIAEAQVLLSSTELSVAEIGARVGLANPSHFVALFKKIYGTTPNRFRAQNT
ncbi:MAG: AraC family transcriptional regulator [Paenibacillaceae bacterium]|jgi:AraC family transcriptional regulator of adaptative response / methylphosphotriester-DNA alkyltransferase methyltransferase|nr:AraC family transcriptional regulator [Paenibacillaceae bacterium]